MLPGLTFPQTEIGNDPIVIRDLVQAAESMGFRYLLAYDHVLGANPERPGGWKGPYTFRTPFHEVFILFSYLAGLTRTIEFATGILILPQRQTALVAKQAANLDVLSGGRLRLGVGIGWNKVEYDGLGQDFSARGKRSEEQVKLLRQLWEQPLVTFHGAYDRVEDAGINPLPTRRIPIWFGGEADAVFDRMARLGDGWMANWMPLDEAAVEVERLHRFLNAAGRDSSSFGIDVRLSMKLQPRDTWADYVTGWRKLGATHLSLNLMDAGLKGLDDYLRAMREFIDLFPSAPG
jgi:probable F420-dependent oxidoreductase